MILERRIMRDILSPQIAVALVLIVIFSGYSASRFLNDAVNGLLAGETVAVLVFYKVLIAFDVLLPLTLYLAIVLCLSQLHVDNEIAAMEACGIGPGRVIKAVLYLAIPMALLVGGLSLYARPWAYAQIYAAEAESRQEFDLGKVEAGRFYKLTDDLVFFADKLDHKRKLAEQVYIWEFNPQGGRTVTFAEQAQQRDGGPGEPRSIVFMDGTHAILEAENQRVRRISFGKNVLRLPQRSPKPKYRRKAASTVQLAGADSPPEIAEYQWRYATGPLTILLALLAIPLSRSSPRSSRYAKATVAIVLFFIYYNLSLIAKTWVEKQLIPPTPGVWWVNLVLAPPILLLVFLPWLKRGYQKFAYRCKRPAGPP